jgi:hypothetical protein
MLEEDGENRVKIEEMWHRVKVDRDILHKMKRRRNNLIGHILRLGTEFCNTLMRGNTDGRIVVKGKRWRRSKQLVHDLKETKWWWKLQEEVLDRALWRTRFGRGCGPVGRQTAQWMDEWMDEGRWAA